MNFPLSGKTLDIVKGSILTLALFLAYASLPLAGILAGVFAPLPGAFFSLKSGSRVGAAIVLVSAGVLAVVADPATMLLYLLQCAVISVALPIVLARGNGGARAIVVAVAVNVLLFAVAALLYSATAQVDLHGIIRKGIDASIAQTVSLYEKSGLKGEELQLFLDGMQQAGRLIGRTYPALIIVGLGSVAGITLACLVRLAPKLPRPLTVGSFRDFRNPDHLVWALILAGFAMLLKDGMVTGAALNVLIVALTFYFFQGMAIVAFFFNRFATPAFMRTLFYLFLAFQPYLAIGVAVLGVFDLWGNFRSPKKLQNL
jgi:uncharacterized protein YybS (DUF2232 family)